MTKYLKKMLTKYDSESNLGQNWNINEPWGISFMNVRKL